MTTKPLARVAPFAAAVALALTLAGPARAQTPAPQPPLKIAVVNTTRVFNEMAETRALQAKLADDQKRFMDAQKAKLAALEDLRKRRDDLNPNHPQYEELNTQLMRASLEFEVWAKNEKAVAEHNHKRQLKALFEKLQSAVAEVAQGNGLDLVIAEDRDAMPPDTELDKVEIPALRAIIQQKDVLFVGPRADISQQVLAVLDARFKGAGGAPAAAVPPAPAAVPAAVPAASPVPGNPAPGGPGATAVPPRRP